MTIKKDPNLSWIAAQLIGDGHIQIQDWRGLISFYSKDIEIIRMFESVFSRKFGINSKLYTDNRQIFPRYKLFFISREVSQYLVDLGVPKGNKTNQSFGVPDWVIGGGIANQRAFLRGIFSAEGSIFHTNNRGWRIGIEMYKREDLAQDDRFLEDVKDMLNHVGIECSPVRLGRKNLRKDGTYSIAKKLDVEEPSFGNFYKRVGFDDKSKLACLHSRVQARLNRRGGSLP